MFTNAFVFTTDDNICVTRIERADSLYFAKFSSSTLLDFSSQANNTLFQLRGFHADKDQASLFNSAP